MKETVFELEVRPTIPESLTGLEQLANNLIYSWDRNVRGLYYRLDFELWEKCEHNPKVFLRRISQQTLEAATKDNVFMDEYSRVMSSYKSYLRKTTNSHVEKVLDTETDLVAYFCAEFGLHESFPIYSGGLGILAGDHCKAVSDLGVPFVAIGLLYRQGYFTQYIDGSGHQVAKYTPTKFDELPITPSTDADGNEIKISVSLPGREVILKVWEAQAGHVTMYLMDSDLAENSDQDRSITFQLYGGDKTTRIQQEIVLGIGGVRLLRIMGLQPSVWHINEGHAAFQIVERCRELIANGLDFDSALEQVAAGTVFTTHTPVPAGHDIFDHSLMSSYFADYCHHLNISFDEFMSLGSSPSNHGSFNMTAMALRGSRFHNGVSRIHGGVASSMEAYVWPQIPHDENPMTYITNGVHVPTFLAREWMNLFDMRFREWRNKLLDIKYWECVDNIPDHRFWSLRQDLKTQMLEDIYKRTVQRYKRCGCNEALVKQITQNIHQPETDILVLGFARRFATYKRAALLFSDPQRLARLLSDPKRPVLLVFAGKAHPRDIPGQEIIHTIHEYSKRPEFIGKIILLEGYNMALARKLVTGVDVWLNTPEYPLEASGTSGQKAAINGVINLSVLDGWWGEAYDGSNGWAIDPHEQHVDCSQRDREEAKELLDILEYQIIPMFYNRDTQGYSKQWVKLSKASMKSCIPRFNAVRMAMDYVKNLYTPACNQYKLLAEDNHAPARKLAEWKRKITTHWQAVRMHRDDDAQASIISGNALALRIKANLAGLSPDDVVVECLIGNDRDIEDVKLSNKFATPERYFLNYEGEENGEHLFTLDLRPEQSGLNYYKIRMYPYNNLLSHPLETGCMIWL